jgi:hypothetical protein
MPKIFSSPAEIKRKIGDTEFHLSYLTCAFSLFDKNQVQIYLASLVRNSCTAE